MNFKNIVPCQGYLTTDNKLFLNINDATAHQAVIDKQTEYDKLNHTVRNFMKANDGFIESTIVPYLSKVPYLNNWRFKIQLKDENVGLPETYDRYKYCVKKILEHFIQNNMISIVDPVEK